MLSKTEDHRPTVLIYLAGIYSSNSAFSLTKLDYIGIYYIGNTTVILWRLLLIRSKLPSNFICVHKST